MNKYAIAAVVLLFGVPGSVHAFDPDPPLRDSDMAVIYQAQQDRQDQQQIEDKRRQYEEIERQEKAEELEQRVKKLECEQRGKKEAAGACL